MGAMVCGGSFLVADCRSLGLGPGPGPWALWMSVAQISSMSLSGPAALSAFRYSTLREHPVHLILHPITFRRLAFKGPSAVFILACQLSSSLLHPTSTIFLHIYSWLPRYLAANSPPVSDRGGRHL
ncbi:hypothetical protein AMECASPLE_015880 [Ameca splendens]|uniref:Uncharacterized protein n=1 Tax=Ameca splendens TaxID=208324 RepID=A0ABV0ZZ96_9TELE